MSDQNVLRHIDECGDAIMQPQVLYAEIAVVAAFVSAKDERGIREQLITLQSQLSQWKLLAKRMANLALIWYRSGLALERPE